MPNDFLFADECESEVEESVGAWKILVVDDEPEVHAVTKLALSDFSFQGKGIEFISAYSGKEAKELILQHDDIAVVLLDVVMETDDAGLNVARFIRNEANNTKVRIILRTGQPGQAPERTVIVDYDINDYKSKTELTAQKLFTVVMASLRSYRDIMSLEASREGLEKIITASANLFAANSMETFIDGVMQQLTSLIGCSDEALYLVSPMVAGAKIPACNRGSHLVVLAGQGDYAGKEGRSIEEVASPTLLNAISDAMGKRRIVYGEDYLVAYCSSKNSSGSLLYISGLNKPLSDEHRELIELFAQNVQIAFENVRNTCELEDTQREIVHRLTEAAERRPSLTGNHVRRVAEMAYLLARKYGLDEESAVRLRMSVPLHDVGKLAIKDEYQQKADSLNESEWEAVKAHAIAGYEILRDSEHNIIDSGATIARYHHECWDGSGYPDGKSGEQIPVFARITAIVDVYDVLRHKSWHKEPWEREKSLAFISEQRGKRFDPQLVDLFFDIESSIEDIIQMYPE